MLRKPEILAPAGNFACLTAAVESGADAVYIGVGTFSARRDAGFTVAECAEVIEIAHSAGIKVYGAVNIIVFNRELPLVEDTVAELAERGIDGIIAQDMAVLKIARKYGVNVHASTQVAVTDRYGALAAERYGFSRVVLAREMSRDGITDTAALSLGGGIETEVFVCGALCASVSGLCGMSVAFSGRNSKDKRSGNRGTCAQPCRLDFRGMSCLREGDKHNVLSLPDLFLLPYIGELAAAGVTSLKIEGRLRSAEYVRAAVTAVHNAVNGINNRNADKARIAAAFRNRAGFCDFYYTDIKK